MKREAGGGGKGEERIVMCGRAAQIGHNGIFILYSTVLACCVPSVSQLCTPATLPAALLPFRPNPHPCTYFQHDALPAALQVYVQL